MTSGDSTQEPDSRHHLDQVLNTWSRTNVGRFGDLEAFESAAIAYATSLLATARSTGGISLEDVTDANIESRARDSSSWWWRHRQ